MEQKTPRGDQTTRVAPEKLIADIAERLTALETQEAQYVVTRQLCESLYLIMLTLPEHISPRDMGLDEFVTSKLLEAAYTIARPEIPLVDDGSLRYRFKHFRELFMDVGDTMQVLDTAPLGDVADFSGALVIAHSRIFAIPEVVDAIEQAIPSETILECLETSLAALQPAASQ